MRLFLGRYFGWYLWLGCYTAAIGAVVGIACFSIPLLPLLLGVFFYIYPTALAFAAPLNLFILPVAFHFLKEHPKRASWMDVAGLSGGFISPTITLLVLVPLDVKIPFVSNRMPEIPVIAAIFAVVGTLAGFVCARIFNRYGDKPSIFDVNGQLAALHEEQSSANGRGRSAGGTP